MCSCIARVYLLFTFFCFSWTTPKSLLFSSGCRFKGNLAVDEKNADFIITGTVLNVAEDDRLNGLGGYKGQVAVKRVVKGLPPAIQPMSVIQIENFGDPSLCESHVMKRDTKIFLLTKSPYSGNFRLNSSVIRLTLKNLDRIAASMKGK